MGVGDRARGLSYVYGYSICRGIIKMVEGFFPPSLPLLRIQAPRGTQKPAILPVLGFVFPTLLRQTQAAKGHTGNLPTIRRGARNHEKFGAILALIITH